MPGDLLKNCLLEAWQPLFRILVPVDNPKVQLVEDSLRQERTKDGLASSGERKLDRRLYGLIKYLPLAPRCME